MKKHGKKQVNPAPRLSSIKPPPDGILTLDLLGFDYAVADVKAESTPGREPSSGATTWTYFSVGREDDKEWVITLYIDLDEVEVADDVFPMICSGTPDAPICALQGSAKPNRIKVNRARLKFSDGQLLQPQCGFELSIRSPTMAERTRFKKPQTNEGGISKPDAVPVAVHTSDSAADVHRIAGIAGSAGVTRPACLKVLQVMAEMGAISKGTARAEKDILKQAGSKARSINGLFATHSGTEQNYADFRKRHVKNSGNRNGTYYLDMSPGRSKYTS